MSLDDKDYLVKIININLDYYDKICYDDVDECDKFYKLLTVKSKEEMYNIMRTVSVHIIVYTEAHHEKRN